MRIRSIKPEFWRSPDVADLPRELRLLWIGLWSYVDDNGVGIDDYRIIAAELFALDDPIEARNFVRDGLATLSRGLRIVRYTVAERTYLYITGWDKHQRVDKPNKPRYPLPPDDTDQHDEPKPAAHDDNTPPDNVDTPPNSRDPRETLANHPDTLAPGTGEQGNRGTETHTPRAPARPRNRTTPAELNATAARPDAWQLVATWHQDQPTTYRTATRRALAKQADTILADHGGPDTIRAALDLWAAKPDARPGLLPYLYDEALKQTHTTAPQARHTREDKVNGWLTLDTGNDDTHGDTTPALAAIDGGRTA